MDGTHDPELVSRFASYIERQGKRYLSKLESVLSAGETDAVHDVRVASRRLAEPLRIAAGVGGGKRAERAAELLGLTRRGLRRVRELDVLLESLCDGSQAAGLDTQDLARLEGELTRQRDRAMAKARQACKRQKSPVAARMVRETARKLGCKAGKKVAGRIGSRLDGRYVKSLDRLIERDPREGATADLHATRIYLKRLRYVVELSRDVSGIDRPELLKALVGMQDLLGFWNDQLGAVTTISKIARSPRNLSEDAGWSARLLAHCAGRLRDAERAREKAMLQWEEFAACLVRHRSGRGATDAVSKSSESVIQPAS